MKKFIVQVGIICGEYEKSTVHLIESETQELAHLVAIQGECHCDDTEIEQDGLDVTAYDCHGEMYYSIHSSQEIPEEDYLILKKYL